MKARIEYDRSAGSGMTAVLKSSKQAGSPTANHPFTFSWG